jgi:hypothetical protein
VVISMVFTQVSEVQIPALTNFQNTYLFLFLSGSPWADKTTLAILDFHESGKMEDLDNKWILLKKEEICDSKDDNSPATLGLNNMRGNNYYQ